MMRILNPQTNQYEDVEDQVGYHAVLNGHQAEAPPKEFYLQNPSDNQIYQFDNIKDAQNAFQSGGVASTPHQFELQKSAASTVDTLLATGAGALRGFSFGLSDVVGSALSPEIRERLSVLREASPVASAIGEFGGIGTGLLLPGSPVARLAGATERLGAKAGVSAIGMGAGKVVTRGIELAAQGASEGLVYGGATAVSDLALDERPLTAEMIGSEMFKGAITGAAIGGVATPIFGAVLRGAGKTVEGIEGAIRKQIPAVDELRAQFLSRSVNAAKLSRKFAERFDQEVSPEEVHKILAKGLNEIETPTGKKSIWIDDEGKTLTEPIEIYNRTEQLFAEVGDKRKEVLGEIYKQGFSPVSMDLMEKKVSLFNKTDEQIHKELEGYFQSGFLKPKELDGLVQFVKDEKEAFIQRLARNLPEQKNLDNLVEVFDSTTNSFKYVSKEEAKRLNVSGMGKISNGKSRERFIEPKPEIANSADEVFDGLNNSVREPIKPSKQATKEVYNELTGYYEKVPVVSESAIYPVPKFDRVYKELPLTEEIRQDFAKYFGREIPVSKAQMDNLQGSLAKTIHEYKEGLNQRITNRGFNDLTPDAQRTVERKLVSSMRGAIEALPGGDIVKGLNNDFSKLYTAKEIVEKMMDLETAKGARLSPLDWLMRGNLRAWVPASVALMSGAGFGVAGAVGLGTKLAVQQADKFKNAQGLLEMTKYLSTENVIKRRISKALDGRFVKAAGNSVYNYGVGALANYLTSDNNNIKELTRRVAAIDTTPHAQELSNLASPQNVVKATGTAEDIKKFLLSKTPKISIDPSTGIEQKPARKDVLKYSEYVVAATSPTEMIRTLQQGRSLTDVQKEVLEVLYPGVNSFLQSQVHGRNQLSNSPLKNAQRMKATVRNGSIGSKMLITQSTFHDVTQPQGRRVSGVKSKSTSYATQSDRIASR